MLACFVSNNRKSLYVKSVLDVNVNYHSGLLACSDKCIRIFRTINVKKWYTISSTAQKERKCIKSISYNAHWSQINF